MDRSQCCNGETSIALSVDGSPYIAKLTHHRDGSWSLARVEIPGRDSFDGEGVRGTCLAVLQVADRVATDYYRDVARPH